MAAQGSSNKIVTQQVTPLSGDDEKTQEQSTALSGATFTPVLTSTKAAQAQVGKTQMVSNPITAPALGASALGASALGASALGASALGASITPSKKTQMGPGVVSSVSSGPPQPQQQSLVASSQQPPQPQQQSLVASSQQSPQTQQPQPPQSLVASSQQQSQQQSELPPIEAVASKQKEAQEASGAEASGNQPPKNDTTSEPVTSTTSQRYKKDQEIIHKPDDGIQIMTMRKSSGNGEMTVKYETITKNIKAPDDCYVTTIQKTKTLGGKTAKSKKSKKRNTHKKK
jgi:hypothetical protein